MARPVAVTKALLRRMPLPKPDAQGDKETRGTVLVIGGSAKVPGAVLLAGVAALRAGAGKLQIASVSSATSALGVAVPESLVIALPESRTGELSGVRSPALLHRYVKQADAVLVGPGMSSDRAAHALLRPIVRGLSAATTLVLDAAAIFALRHDAKLLEPLDARAVLTPHAGEMATLLDVDIAEVAADPSESVQEAAARFGAVVVLKGAESWIAEPRGALYRYTGGEVGLATSGSGDTLAGIIAGLAARGATPTTAAAWGVYLHGTAGRVLARRVGPVGFLARELLAEVPGVLRLVG